MDVQLSVSNTMIFSSLSEHLLRFFNDLIDLFGILITGPVILYTTSLRLLGLRFSHSFTSVHTTTYIMIHFIMVISIFIGLFPMSLMLSSLPELSTQQTEAMYSFLLRVHKPVCTDPDSGRSSFLCYPSLPLTVFHTISLQYILHHHFVL